MRETALYRQFDSAGVLLYVGIAFDPMARTQQHMAGASWFDYVARIDIQKYSSRRAALVAEKEAVATEHPIFNINLQAPENKYWVIWHPYSGFLDGNYFNKVRAWEVFTWMRGLFPLETLEYRGVDNGKRVARQGDLRPLNSMKFLEHKVRQSVEHEEMLRACGESMLTENEARAEIYTQKLATTHPQLPRVGTQVEGQDHTTRHTYPL